MRVPTIHQAFKWFRTEHRIWSAIQFTDTQFYFNIGNWFESIKYDTPEEAELWCLRKLIQLVQEDKIHREEYTKANS